MCSSVLIFVDESFSLISSFHTPLFSSKWFALAILSDMVAFDRKLFFLCEPATQPGSRI
jgi:hypothetical protein